MSTEVAIEEIRAAVATVVDPCSIATGEPISLVDMGLLQSIAVDDGAVEVTLIVTSPVCWQSMNMIAAVERAVTRIDGVRTVRCRVDPAGEWLPEMMAPESQARLRRLRPIAR